MTPSNLRLVSWNCNGGLITVPGKAGGLLGLEPDVAVVMECSNRIERIGELELVRWAGRLENKGLGVFAKPHLGARVDQSHEADREFFLPVELTEVAFRVLAVWAMNYRGIEGGPDYGRTHDAIRHYRTFLTDGDLVVGDFNDNAVWDRPSRPHYATTSSLLDEMGYSNVYHERTGEHPGSESAETYYQYRHRDKGFFIDHAFLRRDRMAHVREFSIGEPEAWIQVSDHMPLVVDLDLPGLRER